MEMSQSERKQYKNIQFRPEDLAEITELNKKLSKKLNVELSQRATIMYAVRELQKKNKS